MKSDYILLIGNPCAGTGTSSSLFNKSSRSSFLCRGHNFSWMIAVFMSIRLMLFVNYSCQTFWNAACLKLFVTLRRYRL